MTDGYRVDLSALHELVRRLRWMHGELEQPRGKTVYETDIADGALGKGFKEIQDFERAHKQLKLFLEDKIKDLESLIDEFGTKSSRMRDEYHEAEYFGAGPGGRFGTRNSVPTQTD
jgi:hypothetical protein